MSVYVDSLKPSMKNAKWSYDSSCHLVADNLSELHTFATSIGLNLMWFQKRLQLPHYDLTEHMREKAVKAGAIEITDVQLVDMMIEERKKPDTVMKGKMMSEILTPLNPEYQAIHAEGHSVIAFDTETDLMSYTNPVSDLICLTYGVAGSLKGSIKTPWEYDIQQQFIDYINAGQHMVGHCTSFDLSILAFKYPDLLPYIFDGLDRGLFHDTLLREKLLMLTLHGNFEMIEVNGCNVRLGYSLVDLEKKYLNIDRSDLKDDEDAPRKNYAMWKDIPLTEWPEDYITYAIDDAVNTGLIFDAQEKERAKCIEITGHDPYIVETFRVKVSFALRLLECVGSRMDPVKVEEVAERFRVEYAQPRLRGPLLQAGLLLDAVPAKPYANGALAHTTACEIAKTSPERKAARKDKTCGCPPKMKSPVKEKNPTGPLFQYLWHLANTNPNIKVWPSDGCAATLRKNGIYDTVIEDRAFKPEIIASIMRIDATLSDLSLDMADLENTDKLNTIKYKKAMADITIRIEELQKLQKCGMQVLCPNDIKLKTNEEWSSTYAAHDPLLLLWAERKALRKIITDYLPKMYYTDAEGVTRPAETIRGSFYPLCLTGRSSSSASKLYPSRNEQNVDPRVRPCTVPRYGNAIVSTDLNGMELGTLAQKCVSLFGHSVMADNINTGIDNHAYLAAQIAAAIDVNFNQLVTEQKITGDQKAVFELFIQFKGVKEECIYPTFCDNFREKFRQENSRELDRPVLWSDFFNYYRLLAKPTGLGFPGGLGAVTMVSYAKGTYKVDLSLELAQKLRTVWLEAYPEMGKYLQWVKKQCRDPQHAPIEIEDENGDRKTKVFFAYDTPRGMHRARCGFCEAANGAALQAFSAEGALEGLYRFQKATWLAGYQGPLSRIMDFLLAVDPRNTLENSFAINFLHDEILWETPTISAVPAERITVAEKLMINAMEEITPDVKAGAESVAMKRWYKKAEPILDDAGNLVPWEPEPEKTGV